jgi:GGDEF domain-containing protein
LISDTTTWFAVGVSALAVVLGAAVVVLSLRLREAKASPPPPPDEPDAAPAPLPAAVVPVNEIGASIDLQDVLRRALEAATRLGDAAAGLIVLAREGGEPITATFGLSAEESARELLGSAPDGGRERAVALTYRYSEDEEEHDEFRLRAGLALPVKENGARLGTLAVFWRRSERDVSDEELGRLETLAAALVPALRNAFRFENLRARLDLDPATGLHGRRHLEEALGREYARARRHARRLSLVMLQLESGSVPTAAEHLAAAVRSEDILCHLQGGRFAILVPEAGLRDAERVLRRLELAVGARAGDGGGVSVAAGAVELGSDDDAVSFLAAAERSVGAGGNDLRPLEAVVESSAV